MNVRDYLKAYRTGQNRYAKIAKRRRELMVAAGFGAHLKPEVMREHAQLSAEWKAVDAELAEAHASLAE